jgi:hypothetical protein
MFVYIVSIVHYTFALSVVHPETARKENASHGGIAPPCEALLHRAAIADAVSTHAYSRITVPGPAGVPLKMPPL